MIGKKSNSEKVISSLCGNPLMRRLSFVFLIIIFFLTIKEPVNINESMSEILSLAVIILPILIVEPILILKRSIVSSSVFTGLIIIVGTLFFKLRACETCSGNYLFSLTFLLIPIYLGVLFIPITDPSISKKDSMSSLAGASKIDRTGELIKYCVKVRSFRYLLVLELWMVFLAAVSHMQVIMRSGEEMAIVYVALFYVTYAVVFMFSNLIVMLLITKKVKKTIGSIISFSIITPIIIPLLIIYFLALLSLSVKLIGGVYNQYNFTL